MSAMKTHIEQHYLIMNGRYFATAIVLVIPKRQPLTTQTPSGGPTGRPGDFSRWLRECLESR